VDAVASGSASDEDDEVSGVGGFEAFVGGDEADISAVDEWVADVSGVEEYRAVECWDAHAVAVVADAGDDAFHDALGMECAGVDFVSGEVGRAEAEDVGVGDWFGAESGSEGVADDAADAGARAAVGFDCGGMVVGFDLEADVHVAVEGDDSGVVDEDADAPGFVELAGDARDGGFEEVVYGAAVHADEAFEGFVDAVFRPGLGEGFEFDVGGVSAEFGEVVLDCAHFLEVEAEGHVGADLHEAFVADTENGYFAALELISGRSGGVFDGEVSEDGFFDGGVVKDFVADECEVAARGVSVDEVFATCADGARGEAEVCDAFERAHGHGVHYAGFFEDLDDLWLSCGGGGDGPVEGVRLVDGVAEEARGDAVDVALVQGAGDEEDVGDADVADVLDSEVADILEDAAADRVGKLSADGDFDAPLAEAFGHEIPLRDFPIVRNAGSGVFLRATAR